MRRVEALWTIASRARRRVSVVGWYVTWPVEEVNGVMVSDRFIPADLSEVTGTPGGFTAEHPGVYPAARKAELRRLFVRADRFLDPAEREFHETFKVYPVDATRTAMAEHLMKQDPADLTMVFIWGTDAIQHLVWRYYQPAEGWPADSEAVVLVNRDRIPGYYREVDGFLARLLGQMGPRDSIMVVSDHGFGPSRYNPAKPMSAATIGSMASSSPPATTYGGRPPTPAQLVDVTPTALYLLGLPAGQDMEGQVIRDLVEPAFLAAHPPAFLPSYEPDAARRPAPAPVASPMDDDIRRRLKGLGYIQ